MSNPGIVDDIVFDHDDEYVKIRKFMGGVTYIQNGVEFSSGFKAIKILERIKPKDKNIDDMTPDELRTALRTSLDTSKPVQPKKKVSQKVKTARERADEKVKTARERADEKLADYKAPEKPDFVQQALAENTSAKLAEDSI